MGTGDGPVVSNSGRIGEIAPSRPRADFALSDDSNNQDESNSLNDIELSEQEKKIFAVLKEIGDENGTTVRVAGGWVRDKLLGKDSKDIDVSLDNMTGKAFADLVSQKIGGDVQVIKANADKSKHLETATLKIDGLPVDMVNLRKEVYEDGSRVPKMEMGTAEEDADRRDFTINSMFYNLNEGKVEDFTGHGVEDLRNGVIRPPLEGTETFLDDPLRALRAVRFAVRYGFDIAPETMEAMSDPEVVDKFKKTVSLQRLGKEFTEPFMKDPVNAVKLWLDSGISEAFMPELKKLDMDQKSKYHDKTVLDHTLVLLDHVHKIDPDNMVLKLAALFHDFGKPDVAAPHYKEEGRLMFKGHEAVSAKHVSEIMSRLGFDKNTIAKVSHLVEKHGVDTNPDGSVAKFNKWMVEHFKDAEEWNNWVKLREADILASSPDYQEENMQTHKQLVQRAEAVGVEQLLGMKPYLNGNEIKEILGQQQSGKWIGDINAKLMELQINGAIRNKQDAKEFLEKRELAPDGTLQRKKDREDKPLRPYRVKDGQHFETAIDQAKNNGLEEDKKQGTFGTKASRWHGAFVHTYPAEEYKNMTMIMLGDGKAGLAVKKSGDIVSVYKDPTSSIKDAASYLMPEAIAQGGNHLDCFNGFLPGNYALYGFKPVAKLPFSREYAPENWNYERDGEPDIIFMAHDGRSVDQVKQDIAKIQAMPNPDRKEYKAQVTQEIEEQIKRVPTVSSYEEAEELQMRAVAEGKS